MVVCFYPCLTLFTVLDLFPLYQQWMDCSKLFLKLGDENTTSMKKQSITIISGKYI